MKPENVHQSLALIQETLVRMRREFFSPDGPVYRCWGFTWGIAFALTHLLVSHRDWVGPWMGVAISSTWMVAILVAMAYTYRHYAGLRDVSSPAGRRIWLVWMIAFLLLLLTVGLTGSSNWLVGIWAVYTVSILYLMMGALYFDNLQMGTGLWLGLANLFAAWLGEGVYDLAMALLGGGGLIVAGLLHDRIRAGRDDQEPR
ncbi:hypothetical protein SAMN00808754_2991 [Thermanaeromonas toyohensis ToBE]|uniref:Uncharacterized protein n=1 Tax=Thermanaeromonas toyohensis ToBE TaxID=698762 RepID=A0A1W1W2B1_9FIRM|nr:hypothetical protein [Thermanaeromonas toyohensis]SMB99610.1 hypothetical protein SAMN00808754_2991 [Thermanaeromonas toyohensis ToBE]